MIAGPSPLRLLIACCLLFGILNDTCAQERPLPEPEVGKELSSLPGVSLVRLADHGSVIMPRKGWSPYSKLLFKKSVYWAHEVTLDDAVMDIAGVRRYYTLGRGHLPSGHYDLSIRTSGDTEQARLLFFRALEEAFGFRVELRRQGLGMLVLTKNENWERDGFKPSRNLFYHHWSVGNDGQVFDYDIGGVADFIEESMNKPVIDETGLVGCYRGTIEPYHNLADLQRNLAKHGLKLDEVVREVEVVIIEPRNVQSEGSTYIGR